MACAQLFAVLALSLSQAGPPPDSVANAPGRVVANSAMVGSDSGIAVGPRNNPVGISISASDGPEVAASDTTSRRPRAIEYSDEYYTRLRIHHIASFAELPLFGAEYVLGERLLTDERTGYPPSSLKAAHLGVALGLGALFGVNTITGVWNLWESRADPSNRTLRIVHSAAMLGADAGFAWAGAIGGNARNSPADARRHRAVSVGSMALATAGTAMMWLFDK